MIVGILPNGSTAEILLNNLSEADFDLAEVSVILQDSKLREAIAPDGGPLKGTSLDNLHERLLQAGLTEQEASVYKEAVKHGRALVAMIAPEGAREAAKEMFQDHSAESIAEFIKE